MTPVTAYATERMRLIYGDAGGGFRPLRNNEYRTGWNGVEPPISDYARLSLSTVCDAQGKFEFSNVSDGDWYLSTTVYWEVAGRPQGGYLMRRVTLRGGETQNVPLTIR